MCVCLVVVVFVGVVISLVFRFSGDIDGVVCVAADINGFRADSDRCQAVRSVIFVVVDCVVV